MPITVKCEACGKTLKVKDEMAGKRVRCPHCKSVVLVADGPGHGAHPSSAPKGLRQWRVPLLLGALVLAGLVSLVAVALLVRSDRLHAQPAQRVTMAELRTRPPVCGTPITYWTPDNELDETPTKRIASVPEGVFDRWRAATGDLTGRGYAPVPFMVSLVQVMGVLFDGADFRQSESDLLLSRMARIPRDDYDRWVRGTLGVLGQGLGSRGRHVHMGLPWALAAMNELYDASGAYDAGASGRYMARLRQLSREDVRQWEEAMPVYERISFDALLSICRTEAFFPGEVFDRELFSEILGHSAGG